METLEALATRAWVAESPRENPEKRYVTLTVSYEGIPSRKAWQGRFGKEITYDEVMKLEPGTLAVSHINAARGSVAIIPTDFEETYVSPEYTVLKVDSNKVNPTYLWAYLRSPEARARMLSDATGMGRTRVDWEILRHLPVPLIDDEKQRAIGKLYDEYLAGLRSATRAEESATQEINSELDLNNDWAKGRLKSAKPPR
jgi:type I restriction enzyme M protein